MSPFPWKKFKTTVCNLQQRFLKGARRTHTRKQEQKPGKSSEVRQNRKGVESDHMEEREGFLVAFNVRLNFTDVYADK